MEGGAAGGGYGLLGKVYGEPIAFVGVGFLEQLFHLLFAQYDGQQAVFVAVVEKYVGKAGGDNGAKAVIIQCPRGVFAAGTAAEVLRVSRICAPW